MVHARRAWVLWELDYDSVTPLALPCVNMLALCCFMIFIQP